MILVEEGPQVKKSHEFATNAFSIETSRKAFGILSSNIYTQKILAIVRELSTNAWDSHIEANNPEPFDVHIPTWLEPYFSVRDYGTGMSHEVCTKLYTTYFASTKAESNDFTGCMGIGSKAFFCKYDSATITSYYDGVARTYSAYKDEYGIPQFSLLSEEETSEPNGVLVKIDCKKDDVDDFMEAAKMVYRFFPVCPNFNVSEVSEYIQDFNKSLVFDGQYCQIYLDGTSGALMGNVLYNYTVKTSWSEQRLKPFILKLNLGEANFDPGRENLTMDTKTLEVIKLKSKLAYDEVMNFIKSESDKEVLEFDKVKRYNDLLGRFIYYGITKSYKITTYQSLMRSNSRVKTRDETGDLAKSGYQLFTGDVDVIKKYMRQEGIRFAAVVPSSFESNSITKSEDLVIKSVPPKKRGSYTKTSNIRKFTTHWTTCELDTSKPFVFVYTKFDDVNLISSVLKYLEGIGITIELYGVRPHIKKTGKGVELQEFLKGKLPQVYVVYNTSAHASILEDYDPRFKDKNDYSTIKVMRFLGVKIAYNNIQNVYESELFKRKPMMRIVRSYHDENQVKIIKEYLK